MDERRWRIALLIAAAIAISYFDRQTLPVAIKAIQHEIPVTNFQFGQLNLAFLLAYGAMYAAGGKLIDVLGTRRGFFLIMVWWSLACASHGLAAGFGMLAASRLLLGMGEGGGFPAATKAVAEFFPTAERSTAMGLINAGTAVGAVIAPPGIALVIAMLGWRWVFFISGAVGLAWSYWWSRGTDDRFMSSVAVGLRPAEFHEKPARGEWITNKGRTGGGFFDPVMPGDRANNASGPFRLGHTNAGDDETVCPFADG